MGDIYIYLVLISLLITVVNISNIKKRNSDRVKFVDFGYEKFGVMKRKNEFVVKCIKCAEWVKLEAHVCKYCHADLKDTHTKIQQNINHLEESRREEAAVKKAQLLQTLEKIKRAKLTKVIILLLITTIITYGLYVEFWKKNGLTRTKPPSSAHALLTDWEGKLSECSFKSGEYILEYDTYINEPEASLAIDFDKMPRKELSPKLDCFTSLAFGIDFTDYWNGLWRFNNDELHLEIGNGYSMFFSWSNGGEVNDDWLYIVWRKWDFPSS